MALIVEIPPDLETRLSEGAAHEGTDPEEYVLRLLERDLPKEAAGGKRKLAGYGKFRHIPPQSGPC